MSNNALPATFPCNFQSNNDTAAKTNGIYLNYATHWDPKLKRFICSINKIQKISNSLGVCCSRNLFNNCTSFSRQNVSSFSLEKYGSNKTAWHISIQQFSIWSKISTLWNTIHLPRTYFKIERCVSLSCWYSIIFDIFWWKQGISSRLNLWYQASYMKNC